MVFPMKKVENLPVHDPNQYGTQHVFFDPYVQNHQYLETTYETLSPILRITALRFMYLNYSITH